LTWLILILQQCNVSRAGFRTCKYAGDYGTANDFIVTTDGTEFLQTSFYINASNMVAQATIDWTPDQAEWFGETHDGEDQTPGDKNHEEVFSAVQHRNGSTWYNDIAKDDYFNDSLDSLESWLDANYFHIWDNRYPSECC
jgi:hypothetical protein